MDPIKEAMIREEDTGERNPALDMYREFPAGSWTSKGLCVCDDNGDGKPGRLLFVLRRPWGTSDLLSDAEMRVCVRLSAAAPEMLEALKAHREWTDKERAGPQYPAGVSRDKGGEAIWRAWWDEQLYLCDKADKLTRSAIAKAESAS